MTFQETNKVVDFYNFCFKRYWYWWHLLCHFGTWFVRKISLFSLLMPEYAICYVRKLRVLILHSICKSVSHIIDTKYQISCMLYVRIFLALQREIFVFWKRNKIYNKKKKWCSVINRCALLKSWAPATIRILKINTYTI